LAGRSKIMARVRVTYPALNRVEVVERLRKACISLERKLPISRIVLFGSYAQDRYTAGSDIDIIVVYKGRERDDAYKIIVDEVKLPRLEPRVYTEEEFSALMAESPRFARALAEEGIVITRSG
jgi:predicted nucleotidyltransferase